MCNGINSPTEFVGKNGPSSYGTLVIVPYHTEKLSVQRYSPTNLCGKEWAVQLWYSGYSAYWYANVPLSAIPQEALHGQRYSPY